MTSPPIEYRYRGSGAALWRTLPRVRRLEFVAWSAVATGWNGRGEGTVRVEDPGSGVLIFNERGVWRPEGGGELKFRNVFRWTPLGSALIRLEHLRFGPKRPVPLFDLIPGGSGRWRSERPHLCGEDRYEAELWERDWGMEMVWSITGPRKAERIEYRYRPG
ncbi:MAG: DUF6314 family protein [Gemmatimonadales bacterium]